MKNFYVKMKGQSIALSAWLMAFLLSWASFIAPASANGITYSGWVVTFTEVSTTAVNVGIANALWNLWAWFLFILPYLGVALWVVLVIWVVMMLVKRGRS